MIGDKTGKRSPDLIEPLIGYRSWRFADGKLFAPYQEEAWGYGINRARCRMADNGWLPDKLKSHWVDSYHERHPEGVPEASCHCGLYAYHSPNSILDWPTSDLVIGAVKMWGKVEVHKGGLRAEYARPVVLAKPNSLSLLPLVFCLIGFVFNLLMLMVNPWPWSLLNFFSIGALFGGILALGLSRQFKDFLKLKKGLKRAAKEAGIELVPHRKLKDSSLKYGRCLDPALRPAQGLD